MNWTTDSTSRGVRDRGFTLEVEGRTVPGALWTPESAPTRALVLIGHGGGLHKRAEYVVALARRLVRHHNFAAAAIDGPGHGDRRPDGGLDFEKVWAERVAQRQTVQPGITDAMVADWQATLDALQTLPEIGLDPVGYWGLSMGTIFGLPFVAAEPRVRAAVLGLMGVSPEPTTDPWQAHNQLRLGGDARRITVPVLFLAQSDDELVPRDHALALFDLLATRDRRLHLNPGAHAAVPAEEYGHSEAFLARFLATESWV
jgi:pimeloyl-ACP methyl ester carboxylesterase